MFINKEYHKPITSLESTGEERGNRLLQPIREPVGRLWIIGGRFENWEPEAMGRTEPFGGYFYQERLLGANIVGGSINDRFGPSIIPFGGRFQPEREIDFLKRYPDETLFRYNMSYDSKTGLWLGEYQFEGDGHEKSIMRGRVNAKIVCMDTE